MKNRNYQSGFTLIEIMIALLLGLFLAAGLITITQGTKNTYNNQTALSQLQDNQRFAMSVLNDVIQSAGYFPDPLVNTAATDMPLIGAYPFFLTAGQPVFGTHLGGTTPDTITVQFDAGANDTMINCQGQTNGAVQQVFVNAFTVVPNATNPSQGQLLCSVNNGAPVVLVTGVTNMAIWYGINNVASTVSHDVTEYKTANLMTTTDWMNITTVQVTLSFYNPLYGQPGQTATTNKTVTFTRVIGVMTRMGVTT